MDEKDKEIAALKEIIAGLLQQNKILLERIAQLERRLDLKWHRVPPPSAIRRTIVRLDPDEIEKVFREHSQSLSAGIRHPPSAMSAGTEKPCGEAFHPQAAHGPGTYSMSLHHVKDTAFMEGRTPKRVSPFNFSCLTDFALNVLRSKKIENIRGALYTASLNIFRGVF